MANASFSREMRQRADPLWRAIFEHPFVRGVGGGRLSPDRVQFFLKQDYAYLIDFSRVFALASAKSPVLEDMGSFAALLHATLNTEMELHRKICADFGIPAEELASTRKAMITSAYTGLLVRTCYEGDLSDILAVLLPCACGYVEIGQRLAAEGRPGDMPLGEWIRPHCSAGCNTGWYELYESSTRFEYLFVDMSWKKEEWPAAISSSPGRFPR